MAIRLVESFSWCGNIATFVLRYSVGAGGVSISAGSGRFGTAALRAVGDNNQTMTGAPGTANFRMGVACFSDSWQSLNSSTYFLGLFNGATLQCYLTVNSSRRLEARNGSGALLGTGTRQLANSSWYFIEFAAVINNATGSISVAVDGVTDLTLANVDTQNSGSAVVDNYRLRGQGFNAASVNLFSDLFVADDVTLSGKDWRVMVLTPTSDGAASDWTPSTGTSHFALVDEIPPNSDTDYISSATAGQNDLFGLSNLPYDPAEIPAVQVSLFARKDDAAVRQIAALTRPSGTDFAGATITLSSSYVDYRDLWLTNPDGGAWTGSAVDGMQAGVTCIA